MYYSLVGLLALLILIISNHDILLHRQSEAETDDQRMYHRFLYCVIAYYVTDILWGVLDSLGLTAVLYVDTVIYYIAMAGGIYTWTRYVIAYLKDESAYSTFLKHAGRILCGAMVLTTGINFFTPVMFYFDEAGDYHAMPMRHILLVIQVLMFLLSSLYVLSGNKVASASEKSRHRTIGLSGLVMVIFLSVQLFFPLLPLYTIAYMLASSLLRTFVIENEKEEYRKELESSLTREQQQLQELNSAWALAYTDPLTGVKSKLAYSEKEAQIDEAIAGGTAGSVAVVVFDLNRLKYINDTLGHDIGDQYIKEACGLICETFSHSPVFRVGGDEFAAILEGADYENRDALMAQFDGLIDANLKAGRVVVAAGMAEYIRGTDFSFERIFKRADAGMYQRKEYLKSL